MDIDIYDFDKTIERRGSNSVKWDAMVAFFGEKDVLPMWVADMDFQTPPFVINAIQQQLNRAVLGYTFAGEEWYSSIISWFKKRHEWDVEAKSLTFVSGGVRGQAHALQCFTEASDTVMLMTPVYHPFFHRLRLPLLLFLKRFPSFLSLLLLCWNTLLPVYCNLHNYLCLFLR